MKIKDVIKKMKTEYQVPNKQTIWEHGKSVQKEVNILIDFLNNKKSIDKKIPSWLIKYQKQIGLNLLEISIINRYTLFHDCGKPLVKTIDEYG